MTNNINTLNQKIAELTSELKDLSTMSGHYGTLWNQRAELIRERNALLHSSAVATSAVEE